jgi:hypothetical protein
MFTNLTTINLFNDIRDRKVNLNMSLTVNGSISVQNVNPSGTIKTKPEIKTETKASTLSKDDVNVGRVNRGFNAGGFGMFFGVAGGGLANLITKSNEFGFLAGAATGALSGVVASQTTVSWWKGGLIGGAVGAASGAIIGTLSGKGPVTGAIVGTAAGISSGIFGALAPTELINL